jgi:hypothetical protein
MAAFGNRQNSSLYSPRYNRREVGSASTSFRSFDGIESSTSPRPVGGWSGRNYLFRPGGDACSGQDSYHSGDISTNQSPLRAYFPPASSLGGCDASPAGDIPTNQSPFGEHFRPASSLQGCGAYPAAGIPTNQSPLRAYCRLASALGGCDASPAGDIPTHQSPLRAYRRLASSRDYDSGFRVNDAGKLFSPAVPFVNRSGFFESPPLKIRDRRSLFLGTLGIRSSR